MSWGHFAWVDNLFRVSDRESNIYLAVFVYIGLGVGTFRALHWKTSPIKLFLLLGCFLLINLLILVWVLLIFTLARLHKGFRTQYIENLCLVCLSTWDYRSWEDLWVIRLEVCCVSKRLVTRLGLSLRERLHVVQNRIAWVSDLLGYASHSALSEFFQLVLAS